MSDADSVAAPHATTDRVRLLVVDDHPVYRDGLALMLGQDDGLEVVGTCPDGSSALAAVTELAPDVVVMDLHMPGIDGIEATRRILSAAPSTGVLVLTMYEDDDSVFAAMRAGARGYLLKGANRDQIVRAINAVAQGDAVFGAAVAQRIAEYFSAPAGVHRQAGDAFPALTPREREVLELVAAGRSNAAIAHLLFLSPKTVRNHVSNIFAKLQFADRAEAIVRAREAGLGTSS